MIWLFVNFYFEYFVAAMLGALLGALAAKAAVHLRFLEPHVIMNRIFAYVFLACFTLLFCMTYVASKTDPEFSVTQRYQRAISAIQGWFSSPDPLLDQGGLERALRMTTDWVAYPERVFYAKGGNIYSVFTNGRQRRFHGGMGGEIQQVMFSPDGRALAVKTQKKLAIIEVSSDQAEIVYDLSQEVAGFDHIRIALGGIQWSPDSKKLCFFIERSSPSGSYTNWFMYDRSEGNAVRIDLGPRQNIFLSWAKDAQRLYFSQTHAYQDQTQKGYRMRWFEISLASGDVLPVADIFSETIEIGDDVLSQHGMMRYNQDRRLHFESPYVFGGNIVSQSPSGRKIYVNKKKQLCYQSVYGVRYCLFGLATLGDYLTFYPNEMEHELLVRDVRWLPSEKYVLIKHYTHGLLVLKPSTRQVGVLAEGDIGVFGVYNQ